ncbi:hypothetical protein, partial [Caulobacter sp.]|uniref:beta strand repeat-containing protein n=1 Tax=Caulobacter sp. TaxID=78 RepID=UPI001B0DD077
GVYADTSGWTDVTKLTVTDKESTQITAGAAQDVTITNTDQGGFTFIADGGHDVTVSIANSGGTVRVGTNAAPTGALVFTRASTGPGVLNIVAGTSADITLTATNAVNSTLSGGTAVIDGTALTTAIKVKGSQAITADANTAGHTGDNFTINSNAGAITTLEADGFNSVNFFGSAVTTLKIAHGALFSINNSAGPSAATTLTATVDAFIGDFSDQAVYQTLNINREGGASTLDMRMNALKTLTIGGSSALTLYIETNATNLETITVTGAGAFDAGDLTSFSNLTTLSAGTATGAITAKVDGGVTAVSTGSAADVLTVTGASISKSIATGDGDDTVTLSNAATIGATIDGGAGSHDVLKLSAAAAASAFATTYVTGFEVLDIGSLGSRVIDVSALGGASLIKAKDSGTITGLASGATVEIDGEANFTLGGDFTSVNDSLTLNYTGPAPSTGVFLGAVYSTAVETMNIHMDQTGWVPGAYAAMEWRDASATVVNLTGAGYMYVEALVSDNLSKVDASSFDGDVFFYQWGNLATTANVTVTGAAHHDNIFYFRGRGAVTYTGGDATDVVAVGGGANVIDVGTGDDVVFLRAVNSATRFTTVTGLGDPGDRLGLEFSGFTGAVTQVTGHTTLIDYLNASSASTTAGGADVVHWFELGADAYVVWDFSNSATYDENNGAVVKLVGMAGHFSGPLNTVATYETFGLRNYIGRMIEF